MRTSRRGVLVGGAASMVAPSVVRAQGSPAGDAYWRSATIATPLPLLLDYVSASAACAYSVRKLRSAYAGACFNVVRSSDSTATDIGFAAGGFFDAAALLAFCGSSAGTIATWYDQSGNGNNAIQFTSPNGPKVCNSGATFNFLNGTNVIAFQSGFGAPLKNTVSLTVGSIACVPLFFAIDGAPNTQGICDGASAEAFRMGLKDSGGVVYWALDFSVINTAFPANTAPNGWIGLFDSTTSNNSSLYVNQQLVVTDPSAPAALTNQVIGAANTGIVPMHGSLSDFITFTTQLNGTDRAKCWDNWYRTYGTPR